MSKGPVGRESSENTLMRPSVTKTDAVFYKGRHAARFNYKKRR